MKPNSLNRRMLLFLQKLRRIELVDRVANVERIIQRTCLHDTTYEVQETHGEKTEIEKWLLFSGSPSEIPAYVRNDTVTQRWNRHRATHQTVAVALKLEQDGTSLSPVTGTVHMGVFSYLPVREEPTRLKFIVQADFLTSFGRARIQGDTVWNRWLAEQVVGLVKIVTDDLMRNPLLRRNALEVIFPASVAYGDFFGDNVERPLVEYLRRNG